MGSFLPFPAIGADAMIFHAAVMHLKTVAVQHLFRINGKASLHVQDFSADITDQVDVLAQIGLTAVVRFNLQHFHQAQTLELL